MAFFSEDIATYLRTALSSTAIYVGAIPEAQVVTELAAAVRDVPGGTSEYVMGSTVAARVAYSVGIVQVTVRAPKDGMEACEALMSSIHALLRFASGVTVGSHTYDKIMAEVEPYMVAAPDTGERPMWACTYECWLRGAG